MAMKPVIRNSVAGLLLLALVTLAFGGALQCGFVRFDDHGFVYENPVVLAGLTKAGLHWAFTAVYQQWWLPLLWLSFMFDSEVLGTAPWGYHLTNLVLFAAYVLLMAWALRRLTGSFGRSLAVAALFAVHPLRVESVVWITERKDVLSGVFFCLALLAYARHAERPRPGSLALVFGALLLGLMSKASVIVLPALLLLLDYWPLRRADVPWAPGALKAWGRLVLEKAPLFLLAGIFAFINLHTHTSGTGAGLHLSWLHRLGLVPGNYWSYLRLLFWPAHLGVLYPEHDVVVAGRALAALAGLLAVTGVCAWQARRRPYLLVGWLWFLIGLLPEIRGIRLGLAAYADRFVCLASIGLTLALVWGAAEAADRLAGRRGRRILAGAGAGLVVVLALLSQRQTRVWRDSETLFLHTLAVTSGNAAMEYHLANVYVREERWGDAARHYRETLRIRPDYVPAMNNLAWALAVDSASTPVEIEEAVTWAQRALAAAPVREPALLNTLERAQAAAGDFPGAAATAREALGLAEAAHQVEDANKIRWRLGLYTARAPASAAISP